MDEEQEPGAGERQCDNTPPFSQTAVQNSIQQEEQKKSGTECVKDQMVPELQEQLEEHSEFGEMPPERSEPLVQSEEQREPQEQAQDQTEFREKLQPGNQPGPEKQSPNIVPAFISEPTNRKVSMEVCWYCMKSRSTEDLNITQLESEHPYQSDPRPHFGVAHSSRSTPFPLWDREGPREMRRDLEEKMDDAGIVSSCPHCHLGLPLDTLRWHEEKCLLFEAPRKDS